MIITRDYISVVFSYLLWLTYYTPPTKPCYRGGIMLSVPITSHPMTVDNPTKIQNGVCVDQLLCRDCRIMDSTL